ncbi:hypothetical protein ABN763_14805 [Spongiivirga sp. MCCC 1A20706]|uniref:hypothetical protein n=1 Tax=Spongiivirga sp. MCCC 1A20706 TaxID=3160963 RepID=UPI0039774DA7
MAQHKFEDQVKKQLSEREITPSADAWQRLSEQLDGEDKPGIAYWKYAIAACLIGLIGTFLWYQFSTVRDGQNQEQIVNKETEIKEEKVDDATISTPAILTESKIEEKVVVVVEDEREQDIVKLAKEEIKNDVVIAAQDEEAMSYFDTKVAEVVAQVQKLKEEKDSITNAEVEALLASAERDLKLKSIINQNTKTVDADALLLDVETELDRTFRDRVFEAIKNGFQKTKTAVANRNN